MAVGGAALLLALAVGAKYRTVSRQSFVPPASLVVTLTPATGISLGMPVTATLSLTLPWHLRPGAMVVTPGEGTQLVGQPSVRRERLGWGESGWRVVVLIQPYRDGQSGEGRLACPLMPSAVGLGALTAVIPALTVLPADTIALGEPPLAGRLAPGWRDRRDELLALPWPFLGLLVLGVMLVGLGISYLLYRFLRRRFAPAPPPPPWVVALCRLGELRTELVAGGLPAEAAWPRLSDVVRNYLEARFELHAPCQTTAEFLRDLERSDSPLVELDRVFLKDFLVAGDLVKFARQPADLPAITHAVGRAEALVRGTIPTPTPAALPEGG